MGSRGQEAARRLGLGWARKESVGNPRGPHLTPQLVGKALALLAELPLPQLCRLGASPAGRFLTPPLRPDPLPAWMGKKCPSPVPAGAGKERGQAGFSVRKESRKSRKHPHFF